MRGLALVCVAAYVLAQPSGLGSSPAARAQSVVDATPPTIQQPPDITTTATSPCGQSACATVTFSLNVSDPDNTPAELTVICTSPSGSVHTLGQGLDTCQARDPAGNLSPMVSFTITVTEPPPSFQNVPGPITAQATSSSGAVAQYTTPTATDLVDGNLTVSCDHASGIYVFPIGTTTVTCSATNSNHETATATFTVTITAATTTTATTTTTTTITQTTTVAATTTTQATTTASTTTAPATTAPVTTASTPTTTTTTPAPKPPKHSFHASYTLTPGSYDPAVTQATIKKTICRAGWTASARPPASYTNHLKIKQMLLYHDPGLPSDYEEDQLIPLELGGAPKDPKNLWPEPHPRADTVDQLETALKRQVCAGTITLAAARNKISTIKHTVG